LKYFNKRDKVKGKKAQTCHLGDVLSEILHRIAPLARKFTVKYNSAPFSFFTVSSCTPHSPLSVPGAMIGDDLDISYYTPTK